MMKKGDRKRIYKPVVRAKFVRLLPGELESLEKSEPTSHHLAQPDQPGGVILISRRGMRVGAGRCAECGIKESKLWHYAQSNRGPVCLCSNCKAKVFERSFGKSPMDLLDRAYR
jgi:hypothetical protein